MRGTTTTDMHPADIRAAIAKKGLTMAAISRAANLPEYACRHALQGKSRNGEIAIARAIGRMPEDIWPSRFQKPRRSHNRFRGPGLVCLRQK